MKNPILRGNPAPIGYAASVSGWLNVYIWQARQSGGLSITAQERLNRIDACSSLPVAVGDDDPRIRLLALATPGSKWEPGREQKAVIDGAGHHVPGETVTLDPDEFLNALALAAALDREAAQRQEIARIKQGEEAAPTHEALLRFERDRADTEAAARTELQRENGNLRGEVAREKARAKHAEAILMGGSVPETATIAGPRELPKNVRKHGKGYQGYLKVNGKNRQANFSTPEEASGWVTEQRNQLAREETVSEAQHRRYGPDLNPEEIAAMEERAAA
jgi:hypothetical protein